MKALFDQTKHTRWFVTNEGKLLTETTYGGDGSLREAKPNVNHKRGYLYARTTNKNYQMHRLVASAFVPNPDNKPCVNHKDSNRHNNKASNLEWVTHKENTQHAISNGKLTFRKNSGKLKYSNKQCAKVLDRIANGMTYIDAGSIYDMPYSTVAHLARGSRRKI